MSRNYYHRKELTRRRYTFTPFKAVVGFVLSAVFSITLSTYFDNYGLMLLRQVKQVVLGDVAVAPPNGQAVTIVPRTSPRGARTSIGALQQRSKNLASSSNKPGKLNRAP